MIRKLTAIAMAINAVSRPIGMLPIGVPQHRIAGAATGGDAEDVDTDGPSRRMSLIFSAVGAPPPAEVVPAPPALTVTAAQVGRVFGVALDKARSAKRRSEIRATRP